MKKLLLFAAFISSALQVSSQCSMYPVLLSERVAASDLVIEGRVIDQVCFWNAEHNRIYTSNLIDVYKTFKNTGTPFIEVITEGGIVGNIKHVFEPTLELAVGDVGIFTLNPNTQPSRFNRPVYEAYASAQGFIKYDVIENKAKEPFNTYASASTDLYATVSQFTGANYTQVKSVNPFQPASATGNTSQAISAITSFSPTTISAGTYSILTINGSAFGTTSNPSWIAFKNADDGGSTTISPDASEIVSWTATQIKVKVPTDAGTGIIKVNGASSSGVLTIPYSHINVNSSGVYNTKHISQGAGGYVWTYNTSFFSNTAAKAAFERSMNSWRCNTLVNWTLATNTSAVASSVSDGINIVTFNSGMAAGILGQCGSYFAGCVSGGNTEWYVSELDIQFDPTPGSSSWQYGPANATGSQYDFESVTVHELGHGHQLGHVINSSDLMHYSIGMAQNKRTINSDDLSGGLAVMSRNAQSGGTCGEPLMTPLAAGSCSLGSLTAVATGTSSACIGQSIALTDASLGSPTSWSWIMPGGTPASANTQNTSVSYSTSGVKTITLTATKGSTTSTTTKTINVIAKPVVVTTPATSTVICKGQNIPLKATGATSYAWSPGGSGSTIVVSPTITTTYTVIGTASSCTSTPGTILVTVSLCTGLEDLSSHNDISLYPNPSNGMITVSSFANTGKLDISVINTLGQIVRTENSKNPKELVMDVSELSKGVYYVKVQMSDGARIIKVILD